MVLQEEQGGYRLAVVRGTPFVGSVFSPKALCLRANEEQSPPHNFSYYTILS